MIERVKSANLESILCRRAYTPEEVYRVLKTVDREQSKNLILQPHTPLYPVTSLVLPTDETRRFEVVTDIHQSQHVDRHATLLRGIDLQVQCRQATRDLRNSVVALIFCGASIVGHPVYPVGVREGPQLRGEGISVGDRVFLGQ